MNKTPLKINLGAGFNKIPGYVSLDYDIKTNPDYIINLETDNLPFENNSIDEVLAFHILEHLGDGYFHCLQEIYRVCKDGSKIQIKVPYHLSDDFYDDPTHRRPITWKSFYSLSKKVNKFYKENNYSNSLLADYLSVDFEIQKYNYKVHPKYGNIFKRNNERVIWKLENQYNVIKEVEILLEVVKELEIGEYD